MTDQDPTEDRAGVDSGAVVHGGEGDPLGGGVADLKESDEVTEGEPQQHPSEVAEE